MSSRQKYTMASKVCHNVKRYVTTLKLHHDMKNTRPKFLHAVLFNVQSYCLTSWLRTFGWHDILLTSWRNFDIMTFWRTFWHSFFYVIMLLWHHAVLFHIMTYYWCIYVTLTHIMYIHTWRQSYVKNMSWHQKVGHDANKISH